MRRARSVARLTLAGLATLFHFTLLVAGLPLVLPWPRAAARWRNLHFRSWARKMLRALGIRVEVEGSPPAAPFFLVANHLSYVDILVLASRLDATFIAKAEIASWPFLGLVCRAAGTLFIDRDSPRDIPRVVGAIDRLLAIDQGVVLFPEGTSSRGAEVGPFRPPLLEAAARAGYPVSYAALGYRTAAGDPPAHLAVCWWGGMGFGGHVIELAGLSRVDATLVFGAERIRDDDRKRLADRLRLAVERIFTPVVAAEEECA